MATTSKKNPYYWAVGRRKESQARVRLISGSGSILVNGRTPENYFQRITLCSAVSEPMKQTETLGKVNVRANVRGGGLAGQAGAVCLGIARALIMYDPELKSSLRKAGLLTRDPRAKERKKYGQKGARARFQYSKR